MILGHSSCIEKDYIMDGQRYHTLRQGERARLCVRRGRRSKRRLRSARPIKVLSSQAGDCREAVQERNI